MRADTKEAAARVIRAAKLLVVAHAAVFVLAGCGGPTETNTSGSQAENKDLRQEYERLDAEVQRLQGEVERLEGVETSWERGTFIPEDGPQDPDYEQTKESMTLRVYEIEPSGVVVEIFWSDYELLNEDTSEEEEGESS